MTDFNEIVIKYYWFRENIKPNDIEHMIHTKQQQTDIFINGLTMYKLENVHQQVMRY